MSKSINIQDECVTSGDKLDALRVEVDFAVPVSVERRLHELRPAGGEVRRMLRACVDAELLGIDLPQGALERRRRGRIPSGSSRSHGR